MTTTVLEAQEQVCWSQTYAERHAEGSTFKMIALKDQVEKRRNDAKQKEEKRKASPEIKIRVVCKYRPEFYFKVDRTAKLSELFEAWTTRLEDDRPINRTEGKGKKNLKEDPHPVPNGAHSHDAKLGANRFIFCHLGRPIEPEQTPNDLDMEAGDVILAVEFMDLTVPAAVRDRLTSKIARLSNTDYFRRTSTRMNRREKRSKRIGQAIQTSMHCIVHCMTSLRDAF